MPANVSNSSQFTVIAAQPEETAASRYNRDIAQQGTVTVPESNSIPDDRADRYIHQQDEERSSRRYVDVATGVSATGHQDDATDELYEATKEDRSNDSAFKTV